MSRETKQSAADPVQVQPITDTLKLNYMPYAMSVIVSRAIPEIDGFKPAHRKILYTMYRMGLMSGNRAKSADVVGQTMALNPHGDQAIYETLVRLTRGNGSLIHPWIDSKGNFGRVYSRDMQYAASRYTEVRLDSSCQMLFDGLEKDAVEMVDNYSGTLKEPLLLPAAMPTILLNSNQGIAVGMASNICSFNLREICQVTRAYLADPGVDLLEHLPAPDFSTGARLIYVPQEMRQIYETGRGSFKLRAVFEIKRKDNAIEITEIPYNTTAEAIIDDITAAVRTNKIREINDVRDETDLNGLRITIDYKRSADPELLLHKLFRMTGLETSFSCNFNLLIEGRPRTLGVREILKEWVRWRRQCLRNEFQYDLERRQARLHLLRGLEKILLDIDLAIKIIRQTELEVDVIPNLMRGFSIDEVQAEYVAEIKLRHLNRQYLLNRINDIEKLNGEIADLERLLKSDRRINQYISRQLADIDRQYGRERLTRLEAPEEIPAIDQTELIDDYNIRVYLTQEGYFKKLPLTSLRSAGELKLKESDSFVRSYEATNKHELLFLSSSSDVYKLNAWEVEDHKPSDFGSFTPNLLELAEDEAILDLVVPESDFSGQLLLVFANGKVVRIPMNVYETKQNRRKLVKGFYGGSPLVAAIPLQAEEAIECLLLTNQDRGLIFNTDLIPLKATRTSQGIQVVRLRKEARIVRCIPVSELEADADLTGLRIRKCPAAARNLPGQSLPERQIGFDLT